MNLYGYLYNSPFHWFDLFGKEPKPINIGADDEIEPPPEEIDRTTLNGLAKDERDRFLSNRQLGPIFKAHSDYYGNRIMVKNSDDLVRKLKEAKGGDCCIKTLNLTTHGTNGVGGIDFHNGSLHQRDFEYLNGEYQGKLLGERLKPLMCEKCQINLRGCHSMLGEKWAVGRTKGSGFAHALAAASGCAVLGTSNGTNALSVSDSKSPIPTWGNSEGELVQQVNPDGTAMGILGTGNKFDDTPLANPFQSLSGKGGYPDALPY